MNPIRRRSQLFLALAAKHQGYDIHNKQREELRLQDAQELLELLEAQLERADISEELREKLEEKKALLEEKIKEKKKDL
jgi:hypothetical protein